MATATSSNGKTGLTIQVAQNVLGKLGSYFDSHDFIRKLHKKHPGVYAYYLGTENNVNNVNQANGLISSFLSSNAQTLKIKKVYDDFVSINILRYESPNALWKKI